MSSFQQTLTRVGVTNAHWGVCGFTSSLYALYDLNPATRPQIINATAAYRILAEIKTYLMMLKADNSGLLRQITDFTRTFGNEFATFTIDAYIARINEAAAEGKSRHQILSDSLYSIALPPAAVADYIQRLWGWNATVAEFPAGNGAGDGVIGVRSSTHDRQTGQAKPYHGLEHYMYRSGGKIYSWGQSFNSVQEASNSGAGGVPWRVCYVIAAARP